MTSISTSTVAQAQWLHRPAIAAALSAGPDTAHAPVPAVAPLHSPAARTVMSPAAMGELVRAQGEAGVPASSPGAGHSFGPRIAGTGNPLVLNQIRASEAMEAGGTIPPNSPRKHLTDKDIDFIRKATGVTIVPLHHCYFGIGNDDAPVGEEQGRRATLLVAYILGDRMSGRLTGAVDSAYLKDVLARNAMASQSGGSGNSLDDGLLEGLMNDLFQAGRPPRAPHLPGAEGTAPSVVHDQVAASRRSHSRV